MESTCTPGSLSESIMLTSANWTPEGNTCLLWRFSRQVALSLCVFSPAQRAKQQFIFLSQKQSLFA